MKFKALLPVAAFVAAAAFQAKADIVVPVPGFPTSQFVSGWEGSMAGTGTPALTGPGGFWDNQSQDDQNGARCNIGFLLSGVTSVGSCQDVNGAFGPQVPLGVGQYEYLADTTGTGLGNPGANTVPGGWYIANTVPTPSLSTVTLHVEVARLASDTSFGYYINGAGGAQLFSAGTTGLTTAAAAISLNQGDQLSFWFRRETQDPATFVTNGFGSNRFALFRRAPGGALNAGLTEYVIGVEDGRSDADFDYQDMIVSVTVVPEPSSVFALAGAVGATLVYIRRRKKA